MTGFYKDLKTVSDKGMYFLFNSKDKSRLKGGKFFLSGEIFKTRERCGAVRSGTLICHAFGKYSKSILALKFTW